MSAFALVTSVICMRQAPRQQSCEVLKVLCIPILRAQAFWRLLMVIMFLLLDRTLPASSDSKKGRYDSCQSRRLWTLQKKQVLVAAGPSDQLTLGNGPLCLLKTPKAAKSLEFWRQRPCRQDAHARAFCTQRKSSLGQLLA
jgi:hypothetical protein